MGRWKCICGCIAFVRNAFWCNRALEVSTWLYRNRSEVISGVIGRWKCLCGCIASVQKWFMQLDIIWCNFEIGHCKSLTFFDALLVWQIYTQSLQDPITRTGRWSYYSWRNIADTDRCTADIWHRTTATPFRSDLWCNWALVVLCICGCIASVQECFLVWKTHWIPTAATVVTSPAIRWYH